ncbi:Phage transcriptional regulator, AlpA [Pseudomonas viridiflava]|uniref:Phage transcriptional regulator, AlpA n=1 Tax=Pseudomonas syringae pv. ribicola TaxID=55398 RepID=A0A0P9Z808_PSESI|nr:Phage transcriptional regulator, AlpA [Pseudomonas syringae pv. ribicola]KPZ22086.1 Phage transcriptional regulator, AlpA [Pseudomonas viridiflava]
MALEGIVKHLTTSKESDPVETKPKSKTLINRKKLHAMIPLAERTIYNMEQRGDFPRRIALTSRNVAWDLAEVEEWIDACKASGPAPRPGIGA